MSIILMLVPQYLLTEILDFFFLTYYEVIFSPVFLWKYILLIYISIIQTNKMKSELCNHIIAYCLTK